MISKFKKCNVIVAGKKGNGKDLLFQYVIRKRKNEKYYSNISYGYKYNEVKVKDMNLGDNTYQNFITDKINKTPHKFIEKADFYISDGGIYLPSYMDSSLYKYFPSLPIFYALSRHTYNSNVHINAQNFNRVWKALREQADYYVLCRKTLKLPFILITLVTCYDKLDSANRELRPLKAKLNNKYSKAEADKYKAENGDIMNCFIISFKKRIKYDTRAFEPLVLEGERIK